MELYWAYLATVAVFFASPPGPSHVLMISNSMRFGLRRSLATAAGDLTANAIQMTAAAFGLAALIANSAELFTALKWLGVGYLLWVGSRTFRRPVVNVEAAHKPTESKIKQLFWQGFITSAANPKAVIFFAALFPQFIDPTAAIVPQLLLLGTTYLAIDGLLLCCWGGLAERLVAKLRAMGNMINRLSGAMMMAAAVLLGLKDLPNSTK